MLKRSPKNKATTVVVTILCLVAVYIAADSLIKFRSLTQNHGSRTVYFEVAKQISRGDQLNGSQFKKHEMFSNDAPNKAISNISSLTGYSKYDLEQGTILTSDMIEKTASDIIDDQMRIMFIPTKDQLSKQAGTAADLLSVDSEGYSADYVATNVKILYDLNPKNTDEQTDNPGYFVEITEFEAQEIALALAHGDVRFALRQNAG